MRDTSCREIWGHVTEKIYVVRHMWDLSLNASPACDTKNNVEKVESVQRKAARFIMNDFNRSSSVTNMVKELNLDFVELRRKVKKVKLLHSILIQMIFLSSHLILARARDLIKFKLINARIQSYAIWFFTINWNSLPTSSLRETNAKTFEGALYKYYRDPYWIFQ